MKWVGAGAGRVFDLMRLSQWCVQLIPVMGGHRHQSQLFSLYSVEGAPIIIDSCASFVKYFVLLHGSKAGMERGEKTRAKRRCDRARPASCA